MSPTAQKLFMQEIYPIITASIAHGAVKPVGCEDREELVQDCLASAAQMLTACERSGKPLICKSTAYYALQRTKSGRRSTSANRTDALAPTTILDGNCTIVLMDAPVGIEDVDGGQLTLGAMLAYHGDGPDTIAGRNIDWAGYMTDLDPRDTDIIRHTIIGRADTELARKFQISPPRITQRKRKIGRILFKKSDGNVMRDAQAKPMWEGNLRALRERTLRWNDLERPLKLS